MGCRCRETVPQIDRVADRAAMCQTCRHARRASNGSAIACTITSRDIGSIVVDRASCPIARHPDDDGIVRWMGLRWMGVPEPLRWRLVWMLRREPRGLRGCGCVAAIKASRASAWIEPWIDGVVALRARLVAAMSDWRDAMGR